MQSCFVVSSRGDPIEAVVPIHVEVLDPENRPAERRGYYGAKDGKQSLVLNLASNDTPGEWTLQVTELASGRSSRHRLSVRPGLGVGATRP